MTAGTPYGWLVWCGGEVDDDIPADLADVMRHARTLDADYILFDADAEISDGLATFG